VACEASLHPADRPDAPESASSIAATPEIRAPTQQRTRVPAYTSLLFKNMRNMGREWMPYRWVKNRLEAMSNFTKRYGHLAPPREEPSPPRPFGYRCDSVPLTCSNNWSRGGAKHAGSRQHETTTTTTKNNKNTGQKGTQQWFRRTWAATRQAGLSSRKHATMTS